MHVVLVFMGEQLQDDINDKEGDDEDRGGDGEATFSSIRQAATDSIHLLHARDHESEANHARNTHHFDGDILDILPAGVTAPKYEGTNFVAWHRLGRTT